MNLLVGKNNSGKTSVLEAISLLAENGSLPALARSAIQRRQQRLCLRKANGISTFSTCRRFFSATK